MILTLSYIRETFVKLVHKIEKQWMLGRQVNIWEKDPKWDIQALGQLALTTLTINNNLANIKPLQKVK